MKFNIVAEDVLCEVVLRKILREINCRHEIDLCYGKKGFPYIKENLKAFNNSASTKPFIVLVDLDPWKCVKQLLKDWVNFEKENSLIFRVATFEIESWIMADRKAFATFLGVSDKLIPSDTESILKPKEFLIDLANRSRFPKIKDAIVPAIGSTATTGPDFNGKLSLFVNSKWSSHRALESSLSLKKAIGRLKHFCSQN